MNITKFNFYGIRFLSTQHVLEEDELTNLKTKKLNYLQEVNFVLQDNLEIKKDIRKLDLKVDNLFFTLCKRELTILKKQKKRCVKKRRGNYLPQRESIGN